MLRDIQISGNMGAGQGTKARVTSQVPSGISDQNHTRKLHKISRKDKKLLTVSTISTTTREREVREETLSQ